MWFYSVVVFGVAIVRVASREEKYGGCRICAEAKFSSLFSKKAAG